MKLLFDHLFFEHINAYREKDGLTRSRPLDLVAAALKQPVVSVPLALFEHVLGFIVALPIPIYQSIMYRVINGARGLPSFGGMYVRALYYRRILGSMDKNVLIGQNAYFAHPDGVHLSEFSYVDKDVNLLSKTAKVGRRVHIAPGVFVSGGGDFEIEDYACIAANATIITATEVLKDGARCSGPMVSPEQRNVMRGKVLIKKDAFVGANVTILPNVVVEVGSVAGAGITLSTSTKPWGIYFGHMPRMMAEREEVLWRDN